MSTLIKAIFIFNTSVFFVLGQRTSEELSGNLVAPQYRYYCNRKCFDKTTYSYEDHVACTHYPCLPSFACGLQHRRIPFTEEEQNYVLDLHNAYRDLVASGKEERGGNSNSSDMQVLSYDRELEFLAACWANQCKESPIPALGRDKCRATAINSENGQNHWAFASDKQGVDWADKRFIQKAVDSWYNQLNKSSSEIIDEYPLDGTRHFEFFTQIVWSSTYLLGCGRTIFNADRYVGVNIVCNYSPGGNIPKKAVYSRGTPCTKYKDMKKNDKYPSLCGTIRPNHQDDFDPPFTLKSSRNGATKILILIGFILQLFTLN